mgnify:CR=1 FL=1
MRNPSLLLLIVVFILAPFKLSAAADTVAVRETRIPVLIERQDNELFHLRIEAAQSQMLNEVKLDFGKDVNLNEIESVKLYYGGTESVERRGKTYFAPVDYISNNTPSFVTWRRIFCSMLSLICCKAMSMYLHTLSFSRITRNKSSGK